MKFSPFGHCLIIFTSHEQCCYIEFVFHFNTMNKQDTTDVNDFKNLCSGHSYLSIAVANTES